MGNTARLTIIPLRHCDIELARELHNDDTVLCQLTDPTHVTEAQQEKWFQSISSGGSSSRYGVFCSAHHLCEQRFVGVFRVDCIDHKNKSVMVGLDIAKEDRGRGYAAETYEYFLRYFFLTLGMNRVYLYVLETNKIGLHVYEKLGFKEEGRQRQAVFRDGRYVDYIMMSMLRSEYDDRARIDD